MNVELHQAGNIVISAGKALYENSRIDFAPRGNVRSVQFVCAPVFGDRSLIANSVGQWFGSCLKRGLKDIKLVVPTKTTDKHLLGFANRRQRTVPCPVRPQGGVEMVVPK